MDLESYDLTDLPMMFQARLSELQAVDEKADHECPLVTKALRERHQRRKAAIHRLIDQVEAALGTVRDGSYGTCDACSQPIAAVDLAHEHATTLCDKCRVQGSPV